MSEVTQLTHDRLRLINKKFNRPPNDGLVSVPSTNDNNDRNRSMQNHQGVLVSSSIIEALDKNFWIRNVT